MVVRLYWHRVHHTDAFIGNWVCVYSIWIGLKITWSLEAECCWTLPHDSEQWWEYRWQSMARELLWENVIESSCQEGWSNQWTRVCQVKRGHFKSPMNPTSWSLIFGRSFFLCWWFVVDELKGYVAKPNQFQLLRESILFSWSTSYDVTKQALNPSELALFME